MSAPLLAFSAPVPLDAAYPLGREVVVADFDALLEYGVFVQGVTRSGKTNLNRVLL